MHVLFSLLLLACRGTVPDDKDTIPVDTDGPAVDTDTDPAPVDDDADDDGFAADADCDDGDPGVYPGAAEACDGVDQDCDQAVDEGLTAAFWPDGDGDGFGAGEVVEACAAPPGHVDRGDDCDDLVAGVFPGAVEVCDGVDQDCDGDRDEGTGIVRFVDGDGDGVGAGDAVVVCAETDGFVAVNGDCDDGALDVFPSAVERCDGRDEDCDGLVDDDPVDAGTWYLDGDGDGEGGPPPVIACAPPPGAVRTGGDCDDQDATVAPSRAETCDGRDEDCDRLVDEDVALDAPFYRDADGDGVGSTGQVVFGCAAPAGYVADPGDCDDGEDDRFPGNAESCDGLDNDCDLAVDEDVGSTWYLDRDGDQRGDDATTALACAQPAGFVALGGDCLDTAPTVFPGAGELCDGLDNDCNGAVDDGAVVPGTWYRDGDGDGFGSAGDTEAACVRPDGYVAVARDCDDAAADVFPGAAETCDGRDEDCDGLVDDGATAGTWYLDADGDGFGRPDRTTQACSAPPGWVASADDCDDLRDAVYPGAAERCDGRDGDCDGAVDEDAVDPSTFFVDLDGDGVGGEAVRACVAPAGAVAAGGDCDDAAAAVSPRAIEACNGVDDDCDGSVDEAGATGPTAWYADVDGDGWGDPGAVVIACALDGGVTRGGDCDDARAAAFPGAPEVCDGRDDDCDGLVDDGASGTTTWYLDGDGDGYGNPAATVQRCAAPAGYVAAGGDCADQRADAYPGAVERCDGLDGDCDGAVDEDAVDAVTSWVDGDGDGAGDPSRPTTACGIPAGNAGNAGDCDDAAVAVRPGAAELCNGVDDDCDRSIDEGTARSTWYADDDGDGAGDPSTATQACAAPPGFIATGGDCDDGSALARPGLAEACDGVDNDCDGQIDDGAGGTRAWYADDDGDGYGDAADSRIACAAPGGFVADATDCDDGDAARNPGAAEVCDGVDDDCDNLVDDGAADASTWYLDRDGDTWGDAGAPAVACAAPPLHVVRAGDCADTAPSVNPGAAERCDGVDDDCDGVVDDGAPGLTWYVDGDGDGWGGAAVVACLAPAGAIARGGDCDDARDDVRPGAIELCDGVDQDCDGTADDGAVDAADVYLDADGDGYGDPASVMASCAVEPGFVAVAGDCDDDAADISPLAVEICDAVDQDCDGVVDDGAVDAGAWFVDGDADGFGAGAPTRACAAPPGTAAADGDCNDRRADMAPDLDEVCDGRDNDCDGLTDDAAIDAATWYPDLDLDGWGTAGGAVVACAQPGPVYAPDVGDCDDGDPSYNPSAALACDQTDRDCDGRVDNDGDGDGWSAPSCGGADCDDANAAIFPQQRGVCPLGRDCREILDAGRGLVDGVYTVDPDGPTGAVLPFDTRCDMTTDGGGWTLIGTVANDGSRRWNSLDVFTNDVTFGSVAAWQLNYKNAGWNKLIGEDLLVTNPDYHVGWVGVVGNDSFGGFIRTNYPATCSQDFLAGPPDIHSSNLSASQVALHDLIIRARDSNAACFPTTNENALVTFTLSECCWTNGLGNTPGGQATWITHDLSMLKLSQLQTATCTGGYPCNPRGVWHVAGANSYDTSAKVAWAAVWVR